MKRISDEQKRIEELQLSMKSHAQEETIPDSNSDMNTDNNQTTQSSGGACSTSKGQLLNNDRNSPASVMSKSYPAAADFVQPTANMSQSTDEPFVLHKSPKKSDRIRSSDRKSQLDSPSAKSSSPRSKTNPPSNGFLSSSQLSKQRVCSLCLFLIFYHTAKITLK